MSGPPRRVLPSAFLERARQFARGVQEPVGTRPAATVVLLRDTPVGLQAYLLRRAASMAFAAGMYVFPGGRVDQRDAEQVTRWAGPPPEQWARSFGGSAPEARALVCAAVRETFEESGVLLAGSSERDVVADTTGKDWEDDRRRLVERSLSFAAMLDDRGLVLRSDLLRPWAHWITPEFESRRYDTHFFVAALPDGQRTRDVSSEADHVGWTSVHHALEQHRAGDMAMLPPTVETLIELADFPSVGDVLRDAWSREITSRTPKAVVSGDVVHLVLPGEPGYPA